MPKSAIRKEPGRETENGSIARMRSKLFANEQTFANNAHKRVLEKDEQNSFVMGNDSGVLIKVATHNLAPVLAHDHAGFFIKLVEDRNIVACNRSIGKEIFVFLAFLPLCGVHDDLFPDAGFRFQSDSQEAGAASHWLKNYSAS